MANGYNVNPYGYGNNMFQPFNPAYQPNVTQQLTQYDQNGNRLTTQYDNQNQFGGSSPFMGGGGNDLASITGMLNAFLGAQNSAAGLQTQYDIADLQGQYGVDIANINAGADVYGSQAQRDAAIYAALYPAMASMYNSNLGLMGNNFGALANRDAALYSSLMNNQAGMYGDALSYQAALANTMGNRDAAIYSSLYPAMASQNVGQMQAMADMFGSANAAQSNILAAMYPAIASQNVAGLGAQASMYGADASRDAAMMSALYPSQANMYDTATNASLAAYLDSQKTDRLGGILDWVSGTGLLGGAGGGSPFTGFSTVGGGPSVQINYAQGSSQPSSVAGGVGFSMGGGSGYQPPPMPEFQMPQPQQLPAPQQQQSPMPSYQSMPTQQGMPQQQGSRPAPQPQQNLSPWSLTSVSQSPPQQTQQQPRNPNLPQMGGLETGMRPDLLPDVQRTPMEQANPWMFIDANTSLNNASDWFTGGVRPTPQPVQQAQSPYDGTWLNPGSNGQSNPYAYMPQMPATTQPTMPENHPALGGDNGGWGGQTTSPMGGVWDGQRWVYPGGSAPFIPEAPPTNAPSKAVDPITGQPLPYATPESTGQFGTPGGHSADVINPNIPQNIPLPGAHIPTMGTGNPWGSTAQPQGMPMPQGTPGTVMQPPANANPMGPWRQQTGTQTPPWMPYIVNPPQQNQPQPTDVGPGQVFNPPPAPQQILEPEKKQGNFIGQGLAELAKLFANNQAELYNSPF